MHSSTVDIWQPQCNGAVSILRWYCQLRLLFKHSVTLDVLACKSPIEWGEYLKKTQLTNRSCSRKRALTSEITQTINMQTRQDLDPTELCCWAHFYWLSTILKNVSIPRQFTSTVPLSFSKVTSRSTDRRHVQRLPDFVFGMLLFYKILSFFEISFTTARCGGIEIPSHRKFAHLLYNW